MMAETSTAAFAIVAKLSESAELVAPHALAKTWKEWIYEHQLLVRTMGALIQLIPFLIASLIYDRFRYKKDFFSQKPSQIRVTGGLNRHFSYNLLTCYQDWKICLLAWCC